MCFLSANRWGFPAGKQGLLRAPVYREVTPLSKRLTDIRQRIQRERATLLQEGQRVTSFFVIGDTDSYFGDYQPSRAEFHIKGC